MYTYKNHYNVVITCYNVAIASEWTSNNIIIENIVYNL